MKKRRDKPYDIHRIIHRESLRSLLKDRFITYTDQGERQNYNKILMVETLFLKAYAT